MRVRTVSLIKQYAGEMVAKTIARELARSDHSSSTFRIIAILAALQHTEVFARTMARLS